MRTKQDLGLAVFRFRQNLKLTGVNVPDDVILQMANDLMHDKVRELLDQTIESWPLADIVNFIIEFQRTPGSPPIQTTETVQEEPKKRARTPKTAH